ncbi:glycoside hydrolase [Pengzhenrongella phosphoraccumulans]|uniref:glycoside hydrolase n=1 Tax=Pengzhenrongella phosphoraccumulans TaxID=3114394 RepID=UPI003890E30E
MPRRTHVQMLAATIGALVLGAGAIAPAAATSPLPAAPVAAVPIPAVLPTSALPAVTVRPDPSTPGQKFEGWGTSLVWFANATGGYPDEIRTALADMLFGEDGLNLNIARYNIGGGNAPDVPSYLRPGGAVEGWWNAPAGTTRTDVDWWDPADPADWNLEADATQRWWIDRIKDDVTHWEAFSNSPPYFQTVSGYVSGGFDSSAEQIRADRVDDFAAYLVGVVEQLEDAHGIEVDTIDPVNEPNTSYWGTNLGADGNPTSGRQEGAHVGPQMQQQVITALAGALDGSETDAVISAMDETGSSTFTTNWNAYTQDVQDAVAQLNVHTYGTAQRTAVRDIAKGEDKPLWMSEIGGSWLDGQNFESMLPGLGMAQRVVDDLRELEPTAWVLWQPVEDYDNMAPGGESATGSNWGSIQIPFDCTAADTLETCPIYTNTKYDTLRNFTHFIRPGDHLVQVNDTSSVAAVGDGTATVVHVNSGLTARAVTLDLSAFGKVSRTATVTATTTDASGALSQGAPVTVQDASATLEVPAESVTTFVVDGVRGVARDAALAQPGHVYRLQGVQSGNSLTSPDTAVPAGTGVVVRTTDTAAADQLWQLAAVGGEGNRTRYTVTTQAGDTRISVADGAVVLVAADGEPALGAQWIASTTGDGTYTLVNAANGRLLEVGGQSTADGAAVTLWTANSNANQRWAVVDETVLSVQDVEAFTVPGTAPTLPQTVVPVFRTGARGTLPVTWTLPSERRWAKPGTVRVRGVAVDATGARHDVTATVEVDTLVATLPARAKSLVGGPADLPATVTAVGKRGTTTERPVVWGAPAADAFASVGTVTLTGLADAADGRTLAATVRVQVTTGTEENAALAAGTVASATYAEPGYSPDRLRNGDLTDKGWSNWRSGTKNPTDTLTFALPAARTLTGVTTRFFRDGSDSYAASLRVQVRDAAGAWNDASAETAVPIPAAGAPVIHVDLPSIPADAVRVVLTALPGMHMTVSEIEVLALAPGASSDARASGITVDGLAVAGFDPETTGYTVARTSHPEVAVETADPYARVEIVQASGSTRSATVTITSEDETEVRTYTVAFGRR